MTTWEDPQCPARVLCHLRPQAPAACSTSQIVVRIKCGRVSSVQMAVSGQGSR